MTPSPLRLGIYVDGPYRLVEGPSGSRLAPDPADLPFVTFACAIGAHFRERALFARTRPAAAVDSRQLLPEDVRAIPLPDYGTLGNARAVARAAVGTLRGFWRGLRDVDAVLVFGPHPFGLALVLLALARRRTVVLGVRQDTLAYYEGRGGGRLAQAGARALDGAYRLLGRIVPVIAVGPEIAAHYGGPSETVLPLTVSLVRAGEIVPGPVERDWHGEVTLLTVGRIEREKNPLLVPEVLARLERARPGRYRLAWAGTGDLAEAVTRRAEELGVADRLDLLGFVPFGEPLLAHYREAHAFVHVSLTEGVPQVLVEALASSTPVVATDVGGVSAALEGGEAGLLVPPGDADALVAALLRLEEDPELRRRLVTRGLVIARTLTRESQAQRAADFVRERSAA